MKRHEKLIPRSREHHRTLALCLRILRHPLLSHQTEIEAHIPELLRHFDEEEKLLLPAKAGLPAPLYSRFISDHTALRRLLAAPRYDDAAWLRQLAEDLRSHIRFEERELFPAAEARLDDAVCTPPRPAD